MYEERKDKSKVKKLLKLARQNYIEEGISVEFVESLRWLYLQYRIEEFGEIVEFYRKVFKQNVKFNELKRDCKLKEKKPQSSCLQKKRSNIDFI